MLTLLLVFSPPGRGFTYLLMEPPSMWKAIVPVACMLLFSVQAEARPHHRNHYHYHYHHHHHHYSHHQFRSMASSLGDIQGSVRIVSGRPSGCPHSFCGCEASLYRFGRIIPHLNLATNWRRFPRAAPAPGMAAVRSGHVMILQQHLAGNIWKVHDGNSGGHLTREHPRSIAGYTIVDPSSAS
jgi:hypothetical protein